MPTHSGHDKQGSFYQWGSSGKKYYYHSKSGQSAAKAKANAQGQAVHARQAMGAK